MPPECGQRLLADVVFDPFSIGACDGLGYSKRLQKVQNGGMSAVRFLGEFAAGIGQENRSVGLRSDQTGSLQALDRAADGDMRDAKSPGKVDHTGLAGCRNQLCDHFGVILGQLVRMLLARAARIVPGADRFLARAPVS